MIFKKLFVFSLLFLSLTVSAAEPATTSLKIYGFIGNDFTYNSRQNVELVDGLVQLFPKPISPNNKYEDINASAQAEMLSVNTRIGIDISSLPILGAKSTGKIEADFAGFGTTFYVFRVRQAYMKLNWINSELLIGQTWHPLFGNVMPSTFSINGGAPFQPFNRSPQVRFKQTLSSSLSFTAAALYEMQYCSQGPLTGSTSGSSNVFMKNAIAPNLYMGLENKTSYWTTGVGIDFKTLKPEITNKAEINSLSASAYLQYVKNKLQVKAKIIYGENLSDQLMLGGYGVSKYGTGTDSTKVLSYTNFRNGSAWLNIVYGSKFHVGLLLGISKNMGTNSELAINPKTKKFCNYGFGFYDNSDLNPNLKKTDIGYLDQQILDCLFRVAPVVSYNLSNFRFGIEYDLTSAQYGNLQSNGLAINPYSINNHRIIASVSYIF